MAEAVEQSFEGTVRLLAQRWRRAAVLLPAFPLLAREGPLAVAEVSRRTGVAPERIEEAVRAGRCGRDAAGRLVDLYGMTLAPTPHRLEIDGRIVYSCCALWAHVIPKLVGAVAHIESVDPLRRELIRLSVSPDGLLSAEPGGAAAVLVAPGREKLAEDVGAAFCSHVRHFVSRHSARRFVEEAPARRLVELPALQEAAQQLYRAIWVAATE